MILFDKNVNNVKLISLGRVIFLISAEGIDLSFLSYSKKKPLLFYEIKYYFVPFWKDDFSLYCNKVILSIWLLNNH